MVSRYVTMAQPAQAPAQAPAIELGDFQLVVHRRQFPDAHDRWDGNWLEVSARCGQAGAIVVTAGPILEAIDLQRFGDDLKTLADVNAGEAVLRGTEPYIVVRVAAVDGLGQLRVRVELSAEPRFQGHWFEYAIDPSYLADAIRQIDAVLAAFPVRGLAPSPADPAPADE